ncbi:unnamed protein product [Acanthoscelides obtectus]|uniref:Peptidase C19 ubiquitin carboxyl-terminal hydrolase domain-containing protein n=1 Tax=Acanthoscelides obtectus TaxID=200917 RepID=A0A9P0QFQ9_ACAOB|nr:unnamed protein product [Acanthoscelides obtectus]CAK1689053.1 hypothetical protein AOBTE_LOCUS36994 [Acanthoscelides obtectus]
MQNIGAVLNKRSVVVDQIRDYINEASWSCQFSGQATFLSSVYKLYAVVQHSGTLSQGHYIATVLLDDRRLDRVQ